MATNASKSAGKKCGCGKGCCCSKSSGHATKSCKSTSTHQGSVEAATETNSCSRATRTCSKAKKGVKSCAGSRSCK